MLHAKDLMIGDWVTGKKWKELPLKITHINDSGKYYYGITAEGSRVGPFLIEELQPIPLTSEILEKNGFKEEQLPIGVRKVIWESEDTRTEIVLYMDDTMPMEVRKNIYYEDEICYTLPFVWAVHQLQHIIRLCDINKTIEI